MNVPNVRDRSEEMLVQRHALFGQRQRDQVALQELPLCFRHVGIAQADVM